MRLWNWVRDHRTQSVVCLVALLVGILALVRDVIGFQVGGDPGASATTSATTAAPAPVVRRGPAELRMIGGRPDVLETEVDLDSAAPNWGVNSCATKCDLNFRGNVHGIEEAYGNMVESAADHESCRTATAYGFTLSPREAREGAEVCVQTDEGRLAGLVVKEVRKSAPHLVELIVFEVTVWEH